MLCYQHICFLASLFFFWSLHSGSTHTAKTRAVSGGCSSIVLLLLTPQSSRVSRQPGMSRAGHVWCWCSFASVLFPCLTLGSEPRQCRLQCSLLTGHLSHDEMMSVLGGASREARQGIQMHSPMYPCPWSVSSCVRALELRLQVCFSDSLTASFCFRAFPPLLLTREPVRKISMVFLIGNAQMSRENLE